MEGKRIFAAIELPGEAREHVAEFIAGLRREFPNLRVGWERPEKLHITIKFAGNLNETELAVFTVKADRATASCAPFAVTIVNTGAFTKRSGPGVLWLGLDAPPLAGLAAAFDSPDDRTKPKRSFNPHLTIARLREPQNSGSLIDRHLAAKFEPVEFVANELVILESTLLPTGSVYRTVSRHALTGTA